MKKLLLIALSLGAVLVGFNQKVDAAELKSIPKEENQPTKKLFADLDDDEKVVQLPDGSFLKGEATYSSGITKSAIVFNSETDPNAISVEEANEIMIEGIEENSINLTPSLGTRGIIAEFRTVTIKNNGYVQTAIDMKNVGWHSMPAVYVPAAGTGAYLLYKTEGDSALVGTGQQAVSSMFQGRTAGSALGNYSSAYYTGGETMYSYIPRPVTTASGYVAWQVLTAANW